MYDPGRGLIELLRVFRKRPGLKPEKTEVFAVMQLMQAF